MYNVGQFSRYDSANKKRVYDFPLNIEGMRLERVEFDNGSAMQLVGRVDGKFWQARVNEPSAEDDQELTPEERRQVAELARKEAARIKSSR